MFSEKEYKIILLLQIGPCEHIVRVPPQASEGACESRGGEVLKINFYWLHSYLPPTRNNPGINILSMNFFPSFPFSSKDSKLLWYHSPCSSWERKWSFIEHLLYSEKFVYILKFNSYHKPEGGIIPILQMRKLRCSAFNYRAQSYTSSNWQGFGAYRSYSKAHAFSLHRVVSTATQLPGNIL